MGAGLLVELECGRATTVCEVGKRETVHDDSAARACGLHRGIAEVVRRRCCTKKQAPKLDETGRKSAAEARNFNAARAPV
jgi:hypothetical protein